MDSDGVPGPSGGLKKYIFSKITEYVDLQRRKRKCTLQGTSLGATLGLGRGLAGCLMSWVVNERLLASFNEIDLIMVETDLSLKSFQKYFRKMRRADLVERLRIVPPAISENFQWNPHLKKNKSIVATGQWWRYQKNAEFLCKVIAASRREFPEISWHVAGGGSHLVESRLTSIGIKLGENHVQCHEHLPPDQLNKINQAASLIFYSSRQEGFPNTLCEALCCGASFVAPKGIQAFDFCASQNWGSTYASENLQSALVSIEKEMFLWESGDRSAKKLSQNATTLFHRKNVSKKLISTLI
jgi:glycosyltransferase involved in cell wall biosynthesis